MKQHIATHTKQTVYEYEEFKRKFSQNAHLNKHENTHRVEAVEYVNVDFHGERTRNHMWLLIQGSESLNLKYVKANFHQKKTFLYHIWRET